MATLPPTLGRDEIVRSLFKEADPRICYYVIMVPDTDDPSRGFNLSATKADKVFAPQEYQRLTFDEVVAKAPEFIKAAETALLDDRDNPTS